MLHGSDYSLLDIYFKYSEEQLYNVVSFEKKFKIFLSDNLQKNMMTADFNLFETRSSQGKGHWCGKLIIHVL